MSEMLTEMVPGQEDSSDLELLQVRKTSSRGLPVTLYCTHLGQPPTWGCGSGVGLEGTVVT